MSVSQPGCGDRSVIRKDPGQGAGSLEIRTQVEWPVPPELPLSPATERCIEEEGDKDPILKKR